MRGASIIWVYKRVASGRGVEGAFEKWRAIPY
jgi:hypothetical protein